MKPSRIVISIIALGTMLILAGVGAIYADEDPDRVLTEGEGTLSIRADDHEYTIAFRGTGYNLHALSEISFYVPPGVYDFDFFCKDSKNFSGGWAVVAGQTTVVELNPKKCVEAVPPPSGGGGGGGGNTDTGP